MMPQVCLTIVGIIDFFITNLRKNRDQLEHLLTRLEAVALASAIPKLAQKSRARPPRITPPEGPFH